MQNPSKWPCGELFSTCPPSSGVAKNEYLNHVVAVSQWSEAAGCRGILVYSDNSLVDPWLVAQIIVQNTKTLCPLVAIQPIYMHPYTVAKLITTFAALYGRRIYLNMVAGGFKNDLLALNDTTPHDARYDRLVEYTTIIKLLLAGESPVSFDGKFYKVDKLKLSPPLPRDLFPGILLSGSSEAGMAAARAIGATAVKYPRPAEGYRGIPLDNSVDLGIRVGIITRRQEEEAWEIAHARFPEDRKGQLTRQLAQKVSDSTWHKQLSELGNLDGSPYWLVPFENYKTMCPYLVGSYERVADELAGYITTGHRTFILDVPPSSEELNHIGVVFELASKVAKWQGYSKTG